MMLRSGSGHRRVGAVNLIELLVVIAIIAVLMSLITAGVMRALDVGPRAETTARIAAINNAIGTFKSNSQFGQVNYIPAGRPDGTNAPFRLRNAYPVGGNPDQFSPEAQYIKQVFGPGTNLDNLGNPNMNADLDANQTLTFFLGGIADVDGQGNANFTGFANGQQPFAPRVSPTDTRKGPILDLGGRRKYVLGGTGNRFGSITDGYGTPFAYFCAFNGQPNRYYGVNAGGPFAAGVQAYFTGTPPNRKYENESGYQIISAGKDKRFGLTGSWDNVDADGRDDQANFSPNLLGGGRK